MNESCAVTPLPLFKGEPLNAPIIFGLAMTIAGLLLSQKRKDNGDGTTGT